MNRNSLFEGVVTKNNRLPVLSKLEELDSSISTNNETQLKVTIYDEAGYYASIDRSANILKTIDFSHNRIHSGDHYFYYDSVQLNNGGSQDYLFTTPNSKKWCHIIFDFDASTIAQFLLYEATDKNGTTLQVIYDNNRNSLKTSDSTIHKGVAGGTIDGNLLYQYKSGATAAQSKSMSSTRNDDEIVLKENTKYIFRILSFVNSNLANIKLEWYEHINED